MNSAIQCLGNSPFIKEYFLNKEDTPLYEHHINTDNPIAYQGQLASSFANVVEQLWTNSMPLTPISFKSLIGNLNEQFAGREQ